MQQFLHYQIAEKLGAGKNGTTYQAIDLGFERAVVLKLFHDNVHYVRERCQACVEAAERLAHIERAPFAQVHVWDEYEGRLYLVRDYIEGKTFADHCGISPFSFLPFIGLSEQLVEIVDAAHTFDIVLNNITANNVILGSNGRVHITDYQQPAPVHDSPYLADLVYRAPELLAGLSATPMTDQYALGVLFYYMLTGELPFPHEDYDATRQLIFANPPDFSSARASTLAPEIRLVLQKMLSKDPTDRFSDLSELKTTLDEIDFHSAEDSVAVQRDIPPSHRSARFYLSIALLFLLAIILWLLLLTLKS